MSLVGKLPLSAVAALGCTFYAISASAEHNGFWRGPGWYVVRIESGAPIMLAEGPYAAESHCAAMAVRRTTAGQMDHREHGSFECRRIAKKPAS